MSNLQKQVDAANAKAWARGNVKPLLNEIRHALNNFVNTGEETVIDLCSLPMGPGEDEHLEELLGEGEVKAEINALGPSTIAETGIPGVWTVKHCNSEGETVGRFIEITRMPEILKSQQTDMGAGIAKLDQTLEEL